MSKATYNSVYLLAEIPRAFFHMSLQVQTKSE